MRDSYARKELAIAKVARRSHVSRCNADNLPVVPMSSVSVDLDGSVDLDATKGPGPVLASGYYGKMHKAFTGGRSMSIVVSVRVGDGLVIAADSASTLSVSDPTGKQLGVAKVFNHATKLLRLRDYPIGVASWGAGTIGARTISSLVEEFANQRPKLQELGKDAKKLSVKDEAQALKDFLTDVHKKTHPTTGASGEGAKPALGVLVGGYPGNEFFPEEYVFNVPRGEFAQRRLPGEDGAQNFGADWFGITDALIRFHHGRDERVFQIMEHHGVSEETRTKIKTAIQDEVQYPVPFDGMPLQDAVDYALFMAGLAVGRFKFVMGPEMCGGAVDVAVITRQDGFVWVKRKDIEAHSWVPTG